MPNFEIFFPKTSGKGEIIVKEEGKDWFGALEKALSNLGIKSDLQNILCDIKDDGTIHITETTTDMKFLIRELSSLPEKPVQEIGRTLKHRNKNEVLAALFEEVMDSYSKPEQEGLEFFLDLALKYIPAESGSFAIAPLNTKQLHFIATRGPKAESVKGMKIEMGQGIAGFSALNNCLIAVSDVQKDPRFFKEISHKIGYETRSIASSPVFSNNITLGIIELINKKEKSSFDEDDISILRFISEKAGEYLSYMWDQKNNNFDE